MNNTSKVNDNSKEYETYETVSNLGRCPRDVLTKTLEENQMRPNQVFFVIQWPKIYHNSEAEPLDGKEWVCV